MDGFLCINKPAGMTSSDVVMNVRRLTGEKKVGHTGTLDPNACGLLLLALGKASRLIEYTESFPKTYRCKGLLGLKTDTHDIWGSKVFDQRGNFSIEEELLEEKLYAMEGIISQIPSKYSALKVDGQRAYNLARAGKDVNLHSREIGLYSLSLIDYERGNFLFDVTCSSGTYVRTLCDALGDMLGTGACMSFLLRLSCGGFNLSDAISLEELSSMSYEEKLRSLHPMERVLSNMPKARLKTAYRAERFLNGLDFSEKSCFFEGGFPIPGKLVSVYEDDKLLGVALCTIEEKEMIFKAEKVLK